MVVIRRESAGRSTTEREARPIARVTLDDNHIFVKDMPTDTAFERAGTVSPTTVYAPDIEYEPVHADSVRITAKLDAEDIAPSYKREPAVLPEKHVQTANKSKTMIAVYVIAAVLLAVVVFVTGFAISGAAKEVSAAEARLSELNTQIVLQQAQVSHLLDEDTITGKAVNNGLEKIDENAVHEITLTALVEPEQYTVETNWFDRLCAFLSGIFG